MKFRVCFFSLVCSLLLLSACTKKENENAGEEPEPYNPPTSIGRPVETNPPNTNYTPAFSGQTRVNGVTTTTAYQSSIITSQLTAPWGITSLPDGRFLITQKGGSMRIVSNTGTVGSTITGIPAVNTSGQGGLLGLCVDSQFSSNRMIYWVFSKM